MGTFYQYHAIYTYVVAATELKLKVPKLFKTLVLSYTSDLFKLEQINGLLAKYQKDWDL